MTLAATRVAPWMGMTHAVENGENLSVHDFAREAGLLGWNMRLEETPSVGRTHIVNFDVVIDDPKDGIVTTIGRVGRVYTPYPNENLVDLTAEILPNGASVEAMGAIRHNTHVFIAAKLDGDMYLGGEDGISRYLLMSTCHDGRGQVTGGIVALRHACTNALTYGLKTALRTFKVRHGRDVVELAKERSRVLHLTENYFSSFDAEMNKLLDTEMTDKRAFNVFEKAYPKPVEDVKGSMKKWESKFEDIVAAYNADYNANIRNTKFGVLNALEERIDWGRTSRTGNDENIFAASAGFDPATLTEKDRLLALVTNYR